MDGDGDRAAGMIAAALGARQLIILSNVPGLLRNFPDEPSLTPALRYSELEQALAFAGAASEVIGVDLSAAMLAVARRKRAPVHVGFALADATHLPFPAARFDVACISFALHEMPAPVRERVVREMVRVTRPGGTIVVVDYALPASRLASALALRLVRMYERDHYVEFVRSDLAALLEGAGVAVRVERRALLGNVRIVVGDRECDP